MKITSEKSLYDFEAWSGGEITKDVIIKAEKVAEFEAYIDETYPDGIDETDLNDLLRFEDKFILDFLDINPEDFKN